MDLIADIFKSHYSECVFAETAVSAQLSGDYLPIFYTAYCFIGSGMEKFILIVSVRIAE